MAELHVERKRGGGPVWLWAVLLLLILAGVVWGLSVYNQNRDTGSAEAVAADEGAAEAGADSFGTNLVEDTAVPAIPSPTSTAVTTTSGVSATTVTDMNDILRAGNRDEMAGRRVQLINSRIQHVFGQDTFAIGLDEQSYVLVRLNQPAAPTVTLQPGQIVNVTGTIERMPVSEDVRGVWKVTQLRDEEIAGQQVYINAMNVEFQELPSPPAQ